MKHLFVDTTGGEKKLICRRCGKLKDECEPKCKSPGALVTHVWKNQVLIFDLWAWAGKKKPKRALAAAFVILFTVLTVHAETGMASFYGEELRGHTMANGEKFDPDKLTCASWRHPLGTKLEVRTKTSVVVVTVTDRGPNRRLKRVIDLSTTAFKHLAGTELGLVRVKVRRID